MSRAFFSMHKQGRGMLRQWSGVLQRVIIASVCCAYLSACSHSAQTAAPSASPTPQRVRVILSKAGSMQPQRTLSGYIAPLQNVTLSSSLSEPAASVRVVEGDRVKAGDILAVFDVSDLQANLRAQERSATQADANTVRQEYQSTQTIGQGVGTADQAKASLRQATEKLKEDTLNLSRDEALEAKGYIATQTTDTQRTLVATDTAAVSSAQAALQSAQVTVSTNGTNQQGLQGATIAAQRAAAEASRAQADQIRAQISRATITSPVDGVIINRNLNPGEYPNSRTLFTIAQSGTVYAVLNASPSQIPGIRNGQSVQVTLKSEPNRRRAAHIVAVLGQSTPGSTNFTVKALIDNPDDDLLSGLPVSAAITLSTVRGTQISRGAFTDGTQSHVIVVRDHVAHVVAVNVLASNATTAIVSGLAANTAIVSDGNGGIADGDHVSITQ